MLSLLLVPLSLPLRVLARVPAPVPDVVVPAIVNDDEDCEAEKTARAIREAKLNKVRIVKNEQESAFKIAAESTSNNARLDFLMRQAELFAHFMQSGTAPEKKKRGRKPTKPPAELAAAAAEVIAAVQAGAAGEGGSSGGGAAAGAGGPSGGAGDDGVGDDGVARAHHKVSEEQEDDALVQAALDSRATVRLQQQPSLIVGGTMRDYQLEGLNWMINLHDNGINGILADEMGLGKTLQSISLLAFLRESRKIRGPHLVIVPKSTIGNWHREFNRWCPAFKVLRLVGDKDTRAGLVSASPAVRCSLVSCRLVSSRVVSSRVASCRLVSCRVLSCTGLSCRVVSREASKVMREVTMLCCCAGS
jgi:hypothetical protein